MSIKVEYLEKYSVAPSPSRDYYGIKVLHDEIILFLWKISHGPHRVPTIRVTKFSEFIEDKSLQDEIQRVFGNYLLDHIKNITSDKGLSILTLPKNIIARISRYLKLKDVVNLSTLSRASKEVFDNDVVWETLYKKYKRSKVSKEERQFVMASSWKQLLKDKKLRDSIKRQQSLENKSKPIQSEGRGRAFHKNSNSLPFSVKSVEELKKLPTPTSVPTLGAYSTPKMAPEKKKINLKSTLSVTKIPDGSRQKSLTSSKFKTDSKDKDSGTNRSQFTVNKNITQKLNSLTKPKSSINIKSSEKLKPRKTSTSNLFGEKIKLNKTDFSRNQKSIGDSKKELKKVTLPKEIREVKSTILNTEKSLFDDLEDDEMSSFFKESFKNYKSPRSIFNYDFSILEDKKSAGDSKNSSPKSEIQNPRRDFDHVETFSKLSERSESLTDDEEEQLEMDHLTQKYLNARAEFMKKMSESSSSMFSKPQSHSTSSLGGKLQKPLKTIPESLKKTRASIFASIGSEPRNINRDKSKPSLKKEGSLFRK